MTQIECRNGFIKTKIKLFVRMKVNVKLILAGLIVCNNFESLSSELHQKSLSRNLLYSVIIKRKSVIGRPISNFSPHGDIVTPQTNPFSRLRGGSSHPWCGVSCEEDDAQFHVDVRNHPRPGLDHAPWIEAHRQAYIELREHNRTAMLARQAAGEKPPPPLISWQLQALDTIGQESTQTWEKYWAQVGLIIRAVTSLHPGCLSSHPASSSSPSPPPTDHFREPFRRAG